MGWSWWSLGNRPAVFPVLACLLGVVFGPLVDVPWFLWLSISAGALWIAWARGARLGGVLTGLVGACCVGAGLGELSADVPVPPVGARVALEGQVERLGPHGFTLAVARVDGVPMRFRAALSADQPPPLLEGQVVRVEARLKQVQEAANPGEWNRSEWAWRRGQPVTGSYAPARLVVLTPAAPWRQWLAAEHAALVKDTHALTDDATAAAFLLTLSAGFELGGELERIDDPQQFKEVASGGCRVGERQLDLLVGSDDEYAPHRRRVVGVRVDHVVEVCNVARRVRDDREVHLRALRLIDVADPAVMIVDGVDAISPV